MDIAEYAMPSHWQKYMVKLGFNLAQHMPAEFVEFFKCMEFGKGAPEPIEQDA